MTHTLAYPEAVAARLRMEMARQQKTVAELATALGLKERRSARARYDGSKSLTLAEVEVAALWLGVHHNDLLGVHPEAVAS